MKKKSGARYPSQVKYDDRNPVISFRVTQEELERIEEIARLSGKSVGVMVREQLGIYAKDARDKSVYQQGYNEGFAEASEQFRIWYHCCICGEKLWLAPDSNAHEAMMELMWTADWAHNSCHNNQGDG